MTEAELQDFLRELRDCAARVKSYKYGVEDCRMAEHRRGITVITYDEGRLVAALTGLDRSHKTAFAAACATTLSTALPTPSKILGGPEAVAQLQECLDTCWTAVAGGDARDVARAAEVAGTLVPDEDDGEWVVAVGYAQNVAAAIEYACRTWVSDDPQQAAWAARQVFEAADLRAQQSMPQEQTDYGAGGEDAPLKSVIMQRALAAAISANFEDVKRLEPSNWQQLRGRAAQRGADWYRQESAKSH